MCVIVDQKLFICCIDIGIKVRKNVLSVSINIYSVYKTKLPDLVMLFA